MILTIAHTFAYALIQTFGFSIFTLALQRLGRLKRLYRLKAFFFLLLMNAAGTMTYGEAAWQRVTTPIAAALLASGVRVFRKTAKKGYPRGVFCGIGRCTDCVMTVDGKPNVRTCVTPVRAGMKVETHNGLGRWADEA